MKWQTALLLDLPSESVGENLAVFHLMSLPSEYKAKLPAAGNFSLKQRVETSSEFFPQILREKTLPSNNNSMNKK